MRLGICSYAVVCAVVSAGAFVVACSSDDGVKATPVGGDAGPLPDATPDQNTPEVEAGEPPPPVFSAVEIAAMNTLTPLPAIPADTTNAYANNALAAVLGQRLFFDKSYSGALTIGGIGGATGAVGATGTVGCISCHQSKGTDDDRSMPNNVSLGTAYGTRNALSIVNASFYTWTNWAGRFDSQWSLPPAVAENPATMKSSRLQIAHLLWDKYKADYNAIFPVPLDADLDPAGANPLRFPAAGKPGATEWDGMAPDDQAIVNRIFANFGKAIAAYLRLEVSRNGASRHRHRFGRPPRALQARRPLVSSGRRLRPSAGRSDVRGRLPDRAGRSAVRVLAVRVLARASERRACGHRGARPPRRAGPAAARDRRAHAPGL